MKRRDCSVPRLSRELLPSGFVVEREAVAGCGGGVLPCWSVEVLAPLGVRVFPGCGRAVLARLSHSDVGKAVFLGYRIRNALIINDATFRISLCRDYKCSPPLTGTAAAAILPPCSSGPRTRPPANASRCWKPTATPRARRGTGWRSRWATPASAKRTAGPLQWRSSGVCMGKGSCCRRLRVRRSNAGLTGFSSRLNARGAGANTARRGVVPAGVFPAGRGRGDSGGVGIVLPASAEGASAGAARSPAGQL